MNFINLSRILPNGLLIKTFPFLSYHYFIIYHQKKLLYPYNYHFLLHNKNGDFMTEAEEIDILQEMYKHCEICYYCTSKILNNIKGTKSKFKSILYKEKKNYKDLKYEITDILDDYDVAPEKVGFLTKLSCGIEINMKISEDDIKIASSIIINKIKETLNEIENKDKILEDLDSNVLSLYQKFTTFQKEELKKLEKYIKF